VRKGTGERRERDKVFRLASADGAVKSKTRAPGIVYKRFDFFAEKKHKRCGKVLAALGRRGKTTESFSLISLGEKAEPRRNSVGCMKRTGLWAGQWKKREAQIKK